jgi:hypothetical protein
MHINHISLQEPINLAKFISPTLTKIGFYCQIQNKLRRKNLFLFQCKDNKR